MSRDDIEHIRDTFPIVPRDEEAAHGEYRTKRLIPDAFDRVGDRPPSRSLSAIASNGIFGR